MRLTFVVLVVSLVGCRPMPELGSRCDAGALICSGSKSAFFCENRRWAEYPTPGGCTEANGATTVSFIGATGACPDIGSESGPGGPVAYGECNDNPNTALVCPPPTYTQEADGGFTAVRNWEVQRCDSCSVLSGLIQCATSQDPVEGKQCPWDQKGFSYCDSFTTSITCTDSLVWIRAACPGGCKMTGTSKSPTTVCN